MGSRSESPKAGSTAAELEAFAVAGSGDVPVPKTVRLREGDAAFWVVITRARARDEWSASDLQDAGILARCYADIERLQFELDRDGDVMTNGRGTPVFSPKHALIEMLVRRATHLKRILRIQASVLDGGDLEDKLPKRRAEARAREVLEAIGEDDDDLLAKPPRMQ